MRVPALCLSAAALLPGAELPSWWKALPLLPRMESGFTQESESAVFGKLMRKGTLQWSRGGRLRVEYVGGMTLVSDGRDLIQYDPVARTAQRMDLRSAKQEMPLLNVLVDPEILETYYSLRGESGERVFLEPRRKEWPQVVTEGRNGYLKRVTWTDATGARQVLELKTPRVPRKTFPPAHFTFVAPAGTRWLN